MRPAAAIAVMLAAVSGPGPFLQAGEPRDGVPFDHVVTVRFAGKPEFPVTVLIRAAYAGTIVKSFLVPDESPLAIHCRLPPGEYQMESMLTSASERYWDDPVRIAGRTSATGQFVVRGAGELNQVLGLPQEFFHRFKIEVIGPKPDFVAGKKAPLLSWKPVEKATRYRVYWTESKEPEKRSERDGHLEVETPFVEIDLELTPGARYEWQVDAYDAENRPIGYWGPSHFYSDEQARQAFLHPPARPDRGGYLGILIVETDHPVPGIRISQVVPGSPASLAGIQSGDVITKLAGVALADVSVSAFVTIARSQPPGTPVEVEYARGFSNPRTLRTSIPMGARPDLSR